MWAWTWCFSHPSSSEAFAPLCIIEGQLNKGLVARGGRNAVAV